MLYLVKTVFKILLIFCVCLISVSSISAKETGYQIIVRSPKLNMRAVSKRNGRVVAVLSKGAVADVLGHIDFKWIKVLYKGKTGFLRNRLLYIRIVAKKNVKSHDIKKAKQNIRKKIRKQRYHIKKYRAQADNIISGLDAIDKAINKSSRRLVGLRKDYFDISVKLTSIQKKILKINRKIEKMQPFVMKRIRAMYKFNLIGEANLLLSAEDVTDFLKREKALNKIVYSDLKIMEIYSMSIKKEKELTTELKKEQTNIKFFQGKISKYLRIKESEKKKKERLLKEIREKEEIKLALIESLKKSEKELDKKLKSLNTTSVTKKRSLFRNFKSYKGFLNLPIKGKIISFFGKNTKNESFHTSRRGIDIRSELGEPVHSIFDGRVVFADWLKGYGNMMIIRHDSSYYSIYAHVQEFFKQNGDMVKRNEVIATIGEGGFMPYPVLYFEIRRHGDPVNPAKWIKMK